MPTSSAACGGSRGGDSVPRPADDLQQIDATLSAASTAGGDVRAVYLAVARGMLDRLAEGLRVRRLALEHAEGDLARCAREPAR